MTTNKTAEELAERCWACAGRSLADYVKEVAPHLETALLAAEQRAQQGWWSEHSCSEAAIRRAKICAAHEANRTGANEPRTVLKLLDALVSAPNTPNTVTTSTDAIAYVKTRLAQIASGDYKACGHTAEEVAADALKAIEAEIGGVS